MRNDSCNLAKGTLLLFILCFFNIQLHAAYQHYIYNNRREIDTDHVTKWMPRAVYYTNTSGREKYTYPKWAYYNNGWKTSFYDYDGSWVYPYSVSAFGGTDKKSFCITSPQAYDSIYSLEIEFVKTLDAIEIDSIHLSFGSFPESERAEIDYSLIKYKFSAPIGNNNKYSFSGIYGSGQIGIHFYLHCTKDTVYNAPFAVKSITVTSLRDFKFDKTVDTLVIGETFTPPALSYTDDSIRFVSSNPDIALVTQDGKILPISKGETTIKAIDVVTAEEASYVLNVVGISSAGGTSEFINVETPGTLSLLASELESVDIRHLTVKGNINAKDISYIKTGAGRFRNLESIDLKDAVVVEGGGAYASWYESNDIGMGKTTYEYFYADTCYTDKNSISDGLGGANTTIKVYGNRLDALFINCPGLKKVVLPANITCIGDYMFAYDNNLESVEFPQTICSIGDNAFNGCEHLLSLVFPQSITQVGTKAFFNCYSLVNVGDLSHVTKMGEMAFSGCTNLVGNAADMTLDLSGLDTIPESAFMNCRLLSGIRFSSSLKMIADEAFCNGEPDALRSLSLPEGLVNIGDNAFASRRGLENVSIPKSLKRLSYSSFAGTPFQNNITPDDGIFYIGNIAIASDYNLSGLTFRDGTVAVADYFNGNKSVTSVSFPNTVEYIGKSAFYEFEITELVLPEGVDEIAEKAFYCCEKLQQCNLPSTLKTIKDMAFSACSELMTLTIPENVEFIGVWAFSGCSSLVRVRYNAVNAVVDECGNLIGSDYYYCVFPECPGMDKVIIGGKVRTLPRGLFKNCSGLLKVEFEDREEGLPLTIGNNVFDDCQSLISCPLPQGTVSIGESAFYQCISLPSDNLFPQGLREIGERAFMRCNALSEVVLKEGLVTLGDHAFDQCTGITTLELPESLVYLGDDILGQGNLQNCNLRELTIKSTDLDLDYHLHNYVASGGGHAHIIERYGAFGNVKTLKTVNIGPKVKYLKGDMFDGCDSLETVNLADANTLEYIGYNTFGSLSPRFNRTPSPWLLPKMYSDEPVYIGSVLLLYNSFDNAQSTRNTTAVVRDGTVGLGGGSMSFFRGDSISLPSSLSTIAEGAIPLDKSTLRICSAALVPPLFVGGESQFEGSDLSQCRIYVPLASVYDYDATPVWRLFWLYPSVSDPAGIDSPLKEGDAPGRWYDLQGRGYDQRPQAPGIYLHGGVKIRYAY